MLTNKKTHCNIKSFPTLLQTSMFLVCSIVITAEAWKYACLSKHHATDLHVKPYCSQNKEMLRSVTWGWFDFIRPI